jgi:hypothetical protein
MVMIRICLYSILIILFGARACASKPKPVHETTVPQIQITPAITNINRTCQPTFDDGVSPSYKPDTPERMVVGQGHVVTGVVLSSVDCKPIANAKLEFWPEEAGLGHPDSSRATFFSDENGR